MRPLFTLLIFLAVATPSWAGELVITFIGNEAFHITDGETTLVSDFPYNSWAFGYMAYEDKDIPEIKDGVSLITHVHGDHWNTKLWQASDLKLIAPEGFTKRLDPARKISISPNQPAKYKDIVTEAIETPHALAKDHYSYVVTWHGLRLYFPGDTETPADMLKQKDIDVMFITPWLIRTIERQDLVLDAKVLIVYHQKLGEEFPNFQNVRRMKQNEALTVSFED